MQLVMLPRNHCRKLCPYHFLHPLPSERQRPQGCHTAPVHPVSLCHWHQRRPTWSSLMGSPGRRHRWSSGFQKRHQPGEGIFDKQELTLNTSQEPVHYGVSLTIKPGAVLPVRSTLATWAVCRLMTLNQSPLSLALFKRSLPCTHCSVLSSLWEGKIRQVRVISES